jgi:hypothetical protein
MHIITQAMIQGHTVLKREAIAYTNNDIRTLDDVRLLLHADNTLRVLVERRESSGILYAMHVYEGRDIDKANCVYNRFLCK